MGVRWLETDDDYTDDTTAIATIAHIIEQHGNASLEHV